MFDTATVTNACNAGGLAMHSTSIFDSEAGNFQNAYGCDPVIHDVSNFLQELESPSERERIFSQVALRYLELE